MKFLNSWKSIVTGVIALVGLFSLPAAADNPSTIPQIPNTAYISTHQLPTQVYLSGYYSPNDGGQGNLVNIPAPTPTLTAAVTNNSNIITVSSGNPVTQNWVPGMPITDSLSLYPTGTYVTQVISSTQVMLSQFSTGHNTSDVFTVSCSNGGLFFPDSVGHCFKRTDFGIKGVVDARQCGVMGIGLTHDDYNSLNTCLLLANALNFPVVSTGGGQVYDNTATITIPDGVTLDCGLGDPTTIRQNSDFTLASGFTHVIAINGSYTITGISNNAFSNCNVEVADGPYAPATFVPTNLRGSLNEVAAFHGIAVTDSSPSFTVSNVFAFGFGTCFQTNNGNKRARFFNGGGHCNVGMNLGSNGDVLPIETMNFMPFLTRQNGTASQNQWQVDNVINNGSGKYRVVAEIPTSDISIQPGDQFAYQAKLNTGVQSAAQVWLAGSPTLVSNGTDGCLATQCQEFTFLGAFGGPDSQDSQPSDGTPLSVTASWVVGAQGNAITVTAGSMANISTGQTVTQSGGCGAIPGGTIVKDVWPQQNIIYLTNALTCGTTGTLTFADSNFVYGAGRQDIVISAVHNNGDCITTTGTSGLKGLNIHCFGHTVNFDCQDNTGNFSIVNFDVGSDELYYDPRITGVYIGGSHVGQDCKGGTITSGVLGQHATTSVVIDSDGSGGTPTFSFSSASMGPSTGKITGVILDVEAGQVVVSGGFGGTKGNIFISAGTTFRNLYPDKTDASANYQVGNILTGNDPGCTTQPQVTLTGVDSGGVVDAEELTQTRAGVCSPWPATFSGSTLTCSNGSASGCGTGAVMTTDGLIGADASINGSDFQQADLYPQTQVVGSTYFRGCGNKPALFAIYSSTGPCFGQTLPGITPLAASVSALNSGLFTGDSSVNLASYFAGGNIGGGILIATTCTVDNGLCFSDSAGNTFQRQSPLWDASEWGILGDHTTDNSSKFQAFLNSAVSHGILTATIDQNGQYYAATGFSVPGFMTLKCNSSRSDQQTNSSGGTTGDHKAIPYSLLVPSGSTLNLSSTGPSGTITGCVVENKAVYDTPNPVTLQDLYVVTGAFGGTGVTCKNNGCKFEKGQILGFNTGFTSTGNDTVQINETEIDANNCISITTSAFDSGLTNNFNCVSNLTSRLNNGLLAIPIANIVNSPSTPGTYRLQLSSPCVDLTGNCPRTGNTVWVGLPQSNNQPIGVESVAGLCTILFIDQSDYECTNSQSTATVTNGLTTTNSVVVTGVTNMSFVRINQGVSGTGIQANTVVVAVAPKMNTVWLSLPCVSSCGSHSDLTFTDHAFSGSDLYNVRPYANFRFGTGILLDAVHNNKYANCLVTSHSIAYDLTDGSVDNSFTACGAEDQQSDLDNSHIGLMFDTTSNSNTFLGGTIHYGANGGTAVLNLQSSGANNTPNTVFLSAIGSQFLGDTTLDDESGNLNASLNSGANHGNIFVSGNIRHLILDKSYLPGVQLWTQNAAAQAGIYGTNNNLGSGTVPVTGTSTNGATANPGGGQANATQVTTDFVRVNGVATTGDSIMLKPAVPGVSQTIYNASTKQMQVFGNIATSDTIDGISSSTGVPQAPGSVVTYSSTASGAWNATIIGASGTGVLCPVSQPCTYTSPQTVNLNSAPAPISLAQTGFQANSNDAGNGNAFESDGTATSGLFAGVRRDGTGASPTAVGSGETDAALSGRAFDGVTVPSSPEGYFRTATTEVQTPTNHGHVAQVGCTPLGSSGTAGNCFIVGPTGTAEILLGGLTDGTTYCNTITYGGASHTSSQCFQTTTGVSTSATTIITTPEDGLVDTVCGSDGTNKFCDQVMFSLSAVSVLSSNTTAGSPAARTYSNTGSGVNKALVASGTYAINTSPFGGQR